MFLSPRFNVMRRNNDNNFLSYENGYVVSFIQFFSADIFDRIGHAIGFMAIFGYRLPNTSQAPIW